MSKIEFRFANEEDAGRILEIYTPYVENTAITFEYEIPSEEEFRARIRKIGEAYPYLVCVVDGVIAAYAYGSRFRERAAYQWVAELSVYSDPAYSGRNIGRALYQALIDLLRLQHISTVMGCVTAPNPASEKLHLDMGFVLVGRFHSSGYKLGCWHDILWYEKEINSHKTAPAGIIPPKNLEYQKVEHIFRESKKLIV